MTGAPPDGHPPGATITFGMKKWRIVCANGHIHATDENGTSPVHALAHLETCSCEFCSCGGYEFQSAVYPTLGAGVTTDNFDVEVVVDEDPTTASPTKWRLRGPGIDVTLRCSPLELAGVMAEFCNVKSYTDSFIANPTPPQE